MPRRAPTTPSTALTGMRWSSGVTRAARRRGWLPATRWRARCTRPGRVRRTATGRPAATGCRRRPSGRRRRAAGRSGGTSLGATSSATARRTSIMMVVKPTKPVPRVTIRPMQRTRNPTPHRSAVSRRTGTGCTTWRATCGSGAGTGIQTRTTPSRRGATPVAPLRARTGWAGVAAGTTSRAVAAPQTEATTTRPAVAATAVVSALPAVQSRLVAPRPGMLWWIPAHGLSLHRLLPTATWGVWEATSAIPPPPLPPPPTPATRLPAGAETPAAATTRCPC